MALEGDFTPLRQEVERQLERMLAHPLFQARKKQADIFGFLVKSALDGKKIEERDLFEEFSSLERFIAGSTNMRTTVSHIRNDLLRQYYEGDGQDDPVIISLPAPERSNTARKDYQIVKRPRGEAYRPEFVYNARSTTANHIALGEYFLRGTPSQFMDAIWHFNALLCEQPDHPEAVLGAIEAIGGMLIGPCHEDNVRADAIAQSLAWMKTLDLATTDAWRIHNVRGLLYTAEGDFAAAGVEFDAALKLDRQGTIRSGWYIVYLVAVGRAKEAARLQGVHAREHPTNAPTQAFYAICLTKANDYDEAKRTFMEALRLDRNCIAAHFGSAQLYLEIGNGAKAEEHARRLESLVEPHEYEHLKRRLGLRNT